MLFSHGPHACNREINMFLPTCSTIYFCRRLQVVDRRLSDYEQLEVLHGARHHVLLVKLNNRLVVLKVFYYESANLSYV